MGIRLFRTFSGDFVIRGVHCDWQMRLLVITTVVAVVAAGGCIYTTDTVEAEEPESFLLSWQQDPATTMTIDWHMAPGEFGYLQFRKKGEQRWRLLEGETVTVPYSSRKFQRMELLNLQPDQLYEFRFSGNEPVYQFRTMPDQLTRPIRFLTGGDMLHWPHWMRHTNESAMRVTGGDVDFAVIGGDLAYADGNPLAIERWYDYFKIWSETMITEEGRVIPHLAAIGNHEVRQAYASWYSIYDFLNPDFARNEAPFYTSFISFPGTDSYGVLDFGDYLSLYLLDSGHLNFVEGDQADWLRVAMNSRPHMRHHIPVYHVAAYPSARDFDGSIQRLIRTNWVPLFEQYGVRLALENHDHTYKRTHPIRENRIDETGIHYVGDGAWGVRTRQIRTDEEGNRPWYLAEADSLRHFIYVEIDGNDLNLTMYDEDGGQIDELRIR